MEEYIQVSAKTKNEAITKAAIELGTASDELDIIVVSEGSSGFFGIGGGPFQVSTLIIFFGLDIKEASVDSIFITFLTTISSLAKYTLNGYTDFSLAVYMIPAAILGGYIGSRLNRKINEKKIALIFIISVLLILTVQTYIVITRYLAFIK